MKLLDDIIEAATSQDEPLSTLLRRCLVLEHRIKNRKLKLWVDKELDGYPKDGDLPDYRQVRAMSRGFFVGIGGSTINNQPLALGVMEPKHREMMENLKLRQPISSYESRPDKASDAQIPWPPGLTVRYQNSFYKGYALNRAWQELPGSLLIALIDNVRTRVLRFALELKDDLDRVNDNPSLLPPSKVEQSVVNNIYGGNILIAASAENFTQIGSISVSHNDIASLTHALRELGIDAVDVQQLKTAIEQDGTAQGAPTIGARVAGWLKEIGKTVGKEGLKVGAGEASKIVTKWIMQYYGFDV